MRTWRLNWQDAKAGDADREVPYGKQGKKHHARRGGNLYGKPHGSTFRKTTRRHPKILKAGFRHRHAGEFQRVNRESQEQEDVQRLRNRGGCAEKRDGTELYGGTARKTSGKYSMWTPNRAPTTAKVARRSLRMAGLPADRNHEDLEFLVLRKYTPEERIAIVKEAIYRTENIGLVVIDGIRDMVHDINNPGESTTVIPYLMTWTGKGTSTSILSCTRTRGTRTASTSEPS